MHDQRVSVTYLGRGLKSLSKTTKKNDIKRAVRLVGNSLLHLIYHLSMKNDLCFNCFLSLTNLNIRETS